MISAYNVNALSGAKNLNLVIGFDAVNYNLKIMRILGRDGATVKVDFVPVPESLFIRGEWAEIVSLGISDYIKKQNFDKSFAVRLVLPDRVVSADLLIVPTFSKSRMLISLEAQVRELYNFCEDYKFNKFIIDSNKTNTTFELLMISKPLLNGILKALSVEKLYIKNSTYAANATVNAAFALRPKIRRQSFIFLDIKPEHARLIAVSGGVTVGWRHIRFGTNVFLLDKVTTENNIVFNDIAEIAVINATERAKKNKMTAMQDDDASDIIEENALVINELDKHSRGEIEAKDNLEAELRPDDSEGEEDTGGEKNEKTPIKVKAYQRKIKKLPAFMQRPAPETKRGVCVENFRLFVKHVLLMKMQIEQGGVYAPPDFALINMPGDYGYVIEETNKDNDFEFRYFEPVRENNVELTEHLDLYGALFTEQFNKNSNL